VAGGEGHDGIECVGTLVDHQIGRDGHSGVVEHGPHVGLVDREFQRVRAGPDHRALGDQLGHQLEINLFVVEGQDVASVCDGPEVGRDERRSEHHLGRHVTGGVVGMLGQDDHGQTELAGRLARHTRQLTSTHEPDRVRAQVARPRPGIRLDSGVDTSGRLREEHHGHGKAAAHREHD
jgi:hypothetical protein